MAVSVNAFYALDFVPLRWPEGGYLFQSERGADGALRVFDCRTPGTETKHRLGFGLDYKSKDSGDWGINVQYKIEPWDLETAFIYMNNTDRLTSGLYSVLGPNGSTPGR